MNTDMDIDINTVTETITCRLVEARADLDITQKELASATGISLVFSRLPLKEMI
jgi:DNA-binding XRE family transcriptional regulator